jgi:hypothetical protein
LEVSAKLTIDFSLEIYESQERETLKSKVTAPTQASRATTLRIEMPEFSADTPQDDSKSIISSFREKELFS